MKAFESRFRGLAAGFERKSAARPFAGAIWFYFSCGLAFLVFPLPVASAAGAVLAVGDSFSTLVGLKFGRRRVVGRKTLEGVLAFFAISLPVSLFFVGMCPAFFGSLAATIAELIPDMKKLENLKKRGWMDDNLLIPLAAGAVMLLSSST
jgi:dolichol kinase